MAGGENVDDVGTLVPDLHLFVLAYLTWLFPPLPRAVLFFFNCFYMGAKRADERRAEGKP